MAVNVNVSGTPEVTAEEAAEMRAEIRRCINEIEHIHQQMQSDDARAEIAAARREVMLEDLKAKMASAFGDPFAGER